MTDDNGARIESGGILGAAPGRVAVMRLRVRNDATSPRAFLLSVVGLDSDWLPGVLRTPTLQALAETEVELPLAPSAGTPPGAYAFIVVVQPIDPVSGHAAGRVMQIESSLVVGDPAQLALEIEPTDPQATRTRRVQLHLTNRGTRPLSVNVSTTSATGLDFSLRQREIDLAAGASTSIRGRLTADRRRWFGQNRRMPFIVTAQGETTPVRIDGVFVAHPVLNRTTTRLIAVVAVLGVWAAAALFAVTAISRHARNSQQTQLSAISGQPSKGGAKGGGNGNGSGSGKNGGSSNGSGKNGGSAAASGGRLNGTVTGAAPGGVTVTMSDTSLTAPQPKQTSFVNVAYSPGGVGKLSSTITDLAQKKTASPVRRTTTAKDGSFAFAGVKSPGYYLVTLTKPGYQSRSFVVSATPGKPLPDLQVAMTAGKGKMGGSVTGPGGSPLPGGAHVTITGGPLELATNAQATGKAIGHWQVDGVSTPGDYVISASADGYGTESQVVHLGASGSAFRHITLHRGVESIEGVISDRSNQPVGGAKVTATNGDVTRSATSLTTGSTGFYSIADLPTGSDYTVTVAAVGFATQTFKVHLGGQKSAATQNATMTSSTATITGSVFDLNTNDPIDSAGLILAGDAGIYKIVSRAGTGQFTFDGVVPGDYTLTVEAFGYEADFRSVTVHAGDVTALDPIGLTIDPTGGIPSTSSITGHVVDAHTGAALQCPTSGGAGCQVHITIRPPQGEPAMQPIVIGADQPYKVPGPNETDPAYANGLPPGLYTLTFKAPGYEPNKLAVAVPESTVVNAVPVALVPNGSIIGHITATKAFTGCVIAVPFNPKDPGTPTAPASTVNCGTTPSAAAVADGTIPCTVDPGVCIGQMDNNGEYEIKFVPAGTYWVYVRTEIKNDPAHAVDPAFVDLGAVQLTVDPGQSRRYDAILNQFGVVDVLLQVAQPSGEPGTVGAGHTVYLYDQIHNTLSAPVVTDGDGVSEFTRVVPGTYVACAADPDVTTAPTSCPITGAPSTTVTGQTDPFQVTYNQTVNVPLVLTKDNGMFIGQVYSLVDNVKHPIVGTTVQISGVTGYSGQVARHDTATAITDANGCFAIGPAGSTVPTTADCPSVPPLTAITFKTAPDSAVVDSTNDPAYNRYGLQRLSGLTFVTDGTTTNGLVLKAPTTPITSNVTVHPSVNGASPDKVSVLATQLAPGAGNVTLSVNYSGTPTAGSDATGTLVWQDASLGSAARNNNEAVPGTYKVKASLDGYDDTTGEFDVPLIEDSASLAAYGGPDLILDAHGALRFSAVDTSSGTGVPVDGATYTLTSSHIAPVTVTAEPDADSVTFPDLSKADGPYTATVRAPGFDATASAPVDVVPGVTTPTEVDLSQLGTLTGTVRGDLGDGHTFPLAGAKVQAVSGSDTFTTVTDVDGTYSLSGTAAKPGLKPGSWDVTYSAFGYVSHTEAGVTVVAGNNAVDPLLSTLTAHTIDDVHVEIQDDTGALVVGAHVVLQNSQLASQPAPCDTDGSGVCTFNDVAPVTYAVIVTEAGFAPLSTSMTVRVGDHATRQDFIFVIAQRGNTVSGTVSGRKLDGSVQTDFTTSNLVVTLTNKATSATVPGTFDLNPADFSFAGVPDGSYALQASATGYQAFSQNVTLAGGQAAFINITLNAPSFQLTVTVASSLTGTSMLGYTVSLQSTTGGQDQNAQPVSVVKGKFGGNAFTTFNQVPQDHYDIVLTAPAGQVDWTVANVDYSAATGNVENDVVVNEALLHIRVSSQHDGSTPTPVAALTVKGPAPATTTVFSGSASGDSSTTDVFVAALDTGSEDYAVAADITGSSGTWTSLTASQTATVTKTTTTTITLSFTEVASLTVTVTHNGAVVSGATVTTDIATDKCATTTAADGTCTMTNLNTAHKYDVTATGSGGSPAATTHNVNVDPGANSLSIAI